MKGKLTHYFDSTKMQQYKNVRKKSTDQKQDSIETHRTEKNVAFLYDKS